MLHKLKHAHGANVGHDAVEPLNRPAGGGREGVINGRVPLDVAPTALEAEWFLPYS